MVLGIHVTFLIHRSSTCEMKAPAFVISRVCFKSDLLQLLTLEFWMLIQVLYILSKGMHLEMIILKLTKSSGTKNILLHSVGFLCQWWQFLEIECREKEQNSVLLVKTST
jgi:hypothetical protein